MLGPFRGVMHSVVTEWADAVTTDGRGWTLYVRGECLYDDLADLERHAVSVPDVKFGTWSERAGLRRAPIRMPTFDARVRAEGGRLLAAVQRHAAELPFALADHFELWLLNAATGLPLALIASGCSMHDCEAPAGARWTPGQLCMRELPEARELNNVIAELAGANPQAQWFERHADGSGSARSAVAGSHARLRQTLPSACFAPLFVDAGALSEQQQGLLSALLRWQSPALLQLPDLSIEQRARFEAAACAHALRLAEQLPLYPRVLDSSAVTAALVEARLRNSRPGKDPKADAAHSMSPDYIEIPDA
ncbi:MAG: hypothetical protein LJE59_14430 [Chromatiaceae bacterium]|jgi:hypothetical protein|nr:hypothetical protein [Chromatiaceae bacterium]